MLPFQSLFRIKRLVIALCTTIGRPAPGTPDSTPRRGIGFIDHDDRDRDDEDDDDDDDDDDDEDGDEPGAGIGDNKHYNGANEGVSIIYNATSYSSIAVRASLCGMA